jgi:hypothetical protein
MVLLASFLFKINIFMHKFSFMGTLNFYKNGQELEVTNKRN